MPKIRLLPEDVINKIAAGEVVERPASIVKELVENSLDAGATHITVELEKAGKFLIRVTDNGEGMDKEDAQNALQRHATSKIRSADDLFAIRTLGFRGEALASIAAVSQFCLTTKQEHPLEGYCVAALGGQVISTDAVAAEQGTIIEVKDLFFNTPARKKFLKSNAVELRHCLDVVLRYALSNPSIGFTFMHEGKELLKAPAVDTLRDRIASVYSIELAKDCLPVDWEEQGVRVHGYVAKPHWSRADKSKLILFINSRWVRNEYITKAIIDAFHSLLSVNTYPVFFLSLGLDPSRIDVNVHPQKTEVKIEQREVVYGAVYTAVRRTLEQHNLIPSLDMAVEEIQTKFKVREEWKEQKAKKKGSAKYAFEPSRQHVLQVKDAPFRIAVDREPELRLRTDYQPANPLPEEHEPKVADLGGLFLVKDQQSSVQRTEKLPPLKLLGQIHKTFFVAETPGGLLFIDQHVVQERVLYEQFMQQFMKKEVAVQRLLRGEIIECSPTEASLIAEKQSELEQWGFLLEPFGGKSYVLKTIPVIFGRLQPKELLQDVLHTLEETQNSIEELQESIITRMSCRASVKAGDDVSIPQMEALLAQLEQCTLPYTCPHGRAILIKIPIDELEKKFKRK